ncbi:mannose-1-phosphate guanylyltransferase/mannose-6-phosphate isomerase [Permianibacter sp. IMCC34836]|uniref:mannose-1-phosphate guanylyltransferase/mannose-6-phosphate isomerase n=1 Tax=Permianibacter fluminis TaxID=2738515 RepID=UPI001554E303|nr:mannose-1-phosphate guanylyltransferase/mannose-6-phosphate isomerase [Permianibacter fluminis]NQD37398.1 mannose-1-phosphate guanylyltransferase/mannose-6-phosphate isomerase [Permianibacter fluminis]
MSTPTRSTLLPVILSGGAGTRLWPLSRELYPKQLLPLIGDISLLQQTLKRIQHASWPIPVAEPAIVANQEHRFLIAEQCRAVAQQARIILEPVGRNTAPAMTVAALLPETPDTTLLLVMPADHIINDEAAFRAAVSKAIPTAEAGSVVTFGIVPTEPHTGYGYLKTDAELGSGVYKLSAFVEKPNRETAEQFLQRGGYYWNSGIFLVRADIWLHCVNALQPTMLSACKAALSQASHDLDFIRLDKAAFAQSPSDSIDYAVMERLAEVANGPRAAVVPMQAGWSDLGSWPSVAEQMPADAHGNRTRGDVIAVKSTNNLALAERRLIALVGVENLIVVETADAVLVADSSQAQAVKDVVQQLQKQGRNEAVTHRRVYRPWGSYEGVDEGARFQVKRISVNPGASLSLQMHYHRAEHWIVVTGTAEVTCGDETFLLTENQSTFIPLGKTHRLSNPGKVPLEMIEVQSGAYLGEDDIVRFSDNYGR